jgi:hypothetical protein
VIESGVRGSAGSGVVGVVVRVPGGWWELPLDPRSRDDEIRALVDERRSADPAGVVDRNGLIKVLRDMAGQAAEVGAVYCGGYTEVVDEFVVSATVVVHVIRARERGGRALLHDPVAIAADIKAFGAPGDRTWRTVENVALPHLGPAARVWGVVPGPTGGRHTAPPVVSMHTICPVGAGTVVMVEATANAVDLADPFFELFEAITDSIKPEYV